MPNSVFTHLGVELTFDPTTDIGLVELRTIKKWYGPLGTYTSLTMAAALGDPEALACIIWIARRKAGKPATDPARLANFSLGEFMGSFVTDGKKVHKPFPPCHLMIDGKEYTLNIETDLTFQNMRQVKEWYPEIGNLFGFVTALFRGDPDALACTAWICMINAGESNVPLPSLQNFSAGEVMDSYEFDEPLEPEEPEVPEVKGTDYTDPSLPLSGETFLAATPTPSGTPTKLVSPTSSTSRQAKRKADPS